MLEYEGIVYRPPSEGESVIIQATVGCPHNKCAFCNMYKEKRFRIRKVEDILNDIDTAGRMYNPDFVRSLFLADGNTVIMRTEQLLRILARIYEVFPKLERVTSYGASQYVALKSPEEWKELRKAGLTRIHCGMETGHEPLLKRVNKGAIMKDHIEGGQAVRAAGIELSMYYMAGLGGMEMWEGHARDSAAVFNAVDPDFIRVRTYTPMPGTEMGDAFVRGEYALMTPHEVLCELRLLVELLETAGRFYSDHWLNFADVHGIMPGDKDRMLATIDYALALPPTSFRPVGMISSSL